jgi:hypothetical protein
MTASKSGDARSLALDTYLAQRRTDGYRVETRSGVQAVICRRHRLSFIRVGSRTTRANASSSPSTSTAT